MIASSPTVSARDNTAAVPPGTKQDQRNPFSFSPPKWNNFKETIRGSLQKPRKNQKTTIMAKNRERGVPPFPPWLSQTLCPALTNKHGHR